MTLLIELEVSGGELAVFLDGDPVLRAELPEGAGAAPGPWGLGAAPGVVARWRLRSR